MALLYGVKALNQTSNLSAPHVFGFQIARGINNPLLEVWNDGTGAAKALVVFPNRVEVPTALVVTGALTGGAHALTGASHTASGLVVGQPLRATADDAFDFGPLDLANTDATVGRLPKSRLPVPTAYQDDVIDLDGNNGRLVLPVGTDQWAPAT